jgi:hypothetical protein
LSFPLKISVCLSNFPMHATCPACIILDWPTLIILKNKNYEAPYDYVIFCYFLSPRSKYSLQHSVHKCPQSTFFLRARDQVSHPYKATDI